MLTLSLPLILTTKDCGAPLRPCCGRNQRVRNICILLTGFMAHNMKWYNITPPFELSAIIWSSFCTTHVASWSFHQNKNKHCEMTKTKSEVKPPRIGDRGWYKVIYFLKHVKHNRTNKQILIFLKWICFDCLEMD